MMIIFNKLELLFSMLLRERHSKKTSCSFGSVFLFQAKLFHRTFNNDTCEENSELLSKQFLQAFCLNCQVRESLTHSFGFVK